MKQIKNRHDPFHRALRTFTCTALTLLLLFAPVTRAFAATYVDEMTESDNSSFKQYHNLTRFPLDAAGALPDKSAFGFASISSPSGWVDYRIQNARTVTVGLYSQGGTYAGMAADGVHIMGAAGGDVGSQSGQGFVQSLYSPSAAGVYTYVQGALQKVHFDDIRYVFAPSADAPADLRGYGVNIYASSGGTSYTRLTASYARTVYTAGGTYYYEELTAAVPSGATHIRVELNDVGQFPLLNRPGQVIYKMAKRYNLLTSVTMEGENLIYGIPEPVVEVVPPQPEASEPEPAESGSKPSASSSGTKATVTVQSAAATAGGSKTPSASSSASKFEGVIVSSPPAGRVGSSRAPAVSSQASAKQSAPKVPAESASEPRAAEQAVYQVPGKNREDDGFTLGVILYIAAVAAALLFVLLRPGKRKK